MQTTDVFFDTARNVGDTLTPHILRHFRPDLVLRRVEATEPGKIVCTGSIIRCVMPGDSVCGAGAMFEGENIAHAQDARFLAIRGALTRELVVQAGGDCPEVYGDPALLMPIIYRPQIKKKTKVGYVPHHVDRPYFHDTPKHGRNVRVISVGLHWVKFIDAILSCERIVSSSLHGIIIAEAYGIPAEWAEYSDKVLGGGFKFRDYLTGTGRDIQGPGPFQPIGNLASIQSGLIDSLNRL